MSWSDLNKRQQEYLQAVYEVDQEQEADEHRMWTRGGRPRPAREWRWIEYGLFDGVPTSLYSKLNLRHLIDEGTGSTFNALEIHNLITCRYANLRRSGLRTLERFLAIQITPQGRKLVREATGKPREKLLPSGTLRAWHWRAMAEAWKARPQGLKSDGMSDYGGIGWPTRLRLREYKVGALIEEYQTWGEKLPHMTATPHISWIRLSPYGEQYYRDNWQRYRDLYPDVDMPHPELPTK
jgi:hypothetical protein